MKIGIIGTGNIAPAYIKGCGKFPHDIQIVACADLVEERAEAFAAAYSLKALPVEALLHSEDVDLIINLTVPAAHAEVSRQVLASGKHVYLEKPLALNRDEGQRVLQAAEKYGLRVGCAPDTFLGAGGQTCRMVIDRGDIGEPVAAAAFMVGHGHESWHPNPSFYYQEGGGPMFDMGPYYLTALVNLLGPMETISAMTKRSFNERIAEHENIKGEVIPVNVDTHAAGTIRFENGALATMIMSFDVWQHKLPCIEIYGTEGTLIVPDPNTFGGDVVLWDRRSRHWEIIDPVGEAGVERGIGVADMARSIAGGHAHRVSGELAYHVLDAMQAFYDSSQQEQHINLTSRAMRPAAMNS